MQLLDQIKHHFFTREFLLFLVIGCINTFNCTLIAALLAVWIDNANLAFNSGYLLSLFIAYYLNSTIVFKEPLNYQRYLKFALSYVPNFLIQNFIVFIFYNQLHLLPLFSYLLAAVLGVPVTFLIVKIFAFSKN